MRELRPDVLVVGAGPAGCATAALLADEGGRAGHRPSPTFPREKVCGDGLAPHSVSMLRRLGVEASLLERGFQQFYSYRVVSTWGDAVVARLVVAADGSRGSFSRTLVPGNRLEPYLLGIRAYVEGVEGLAGALNFFLDRRVLPGYGWVFPGGSPGAPANVGLAAATCISRVLRSGRCWCSPGATVS